MRVIVLFFINRLNTTQNSSLIRIKNFRLSLSLCSSLALAEILKRVTHGVTVGGVQHGTWEAEQAEELSVPPLLCRQVPAWVDHPQ